jgi:DNA-binding transcriptional regulator GbsR (MarR family)
LFIETDILKELPQFEVFFGRMGFKRIDGAVYGLLVLAERPLTSEEIEETLTLSQSAVSLSLKTLAQFGAITTRDSRETKAKLHSAKEDSLSIVASVFRKREEEYISDLKKMAKRVCEKSYATNHENRKLRMQSIISTCEIAESVMNFVITIAEHPHADDVIKRLPKTLDILSQTTMPLVDLTHKLKNNLKGLLE